MGKDVGIAFQWHDSCGAWTQCMDVANNLLALQNESVQCTCQRASLL